MQMTFKCEKTSIKSKIVQHGAEGGAIGFILAKLLVLLQPLLALDIFKYFPLYTVKHGKLDTFIGTPSATQTGHLINTLFENRK